MLVPVDWLREYVDFDIDCDKLADRLTMSGLEVEDIIRDGSSVVYSTYVTPNRPDLLSITGVARDISALLDTDFRYPVTAISENGPDVNSLAAINIATSNCVRYSSRVIQNTVICDSPKWMQDRLIAAGMRPINNVVDATNYVLLEMGQPLHAFDYDLLAEHKVIIRQAYKGEKIQTIDAEEHELSEDMMVIADAKKAIAVAGVMGGYDSEVTSSTTNVLLESANFNRLSIRKTARALQMNTEASFRYERNVDPNLTIVALDRAASLIVESGGGLIATGIIDIYPEKVYPIKLSIRRNRNNMMLGFDLTDNQIIGYLSKLGMKVEHTDSIWVTVPTFRPDIHHEEDLIEEVGRIHGYELIPTTLPVGETMQGKDNHRNILKNKIADLFVSMGMQEIVTGSMVAQKENDDQVVITNPITDDLSRLRDNLLIDMLNVISYNNKRGTRDISLFQIGHIFVPNGNSFDEITGIAGVLTGNLWDNVWNIDKKNSAIDFYTGKGILENLFNSLQISGIVYKPCQDDRFHPGRTAMMEIDGKKIGLIGEINTEMMTKYDLSDRIIAFELDFVSIMRFSETDSSYTPLSKYPAITRDIAAVVPAGVSCENIIELLKSGSDDLLESLELFDVYTGLPLQEGQKSMAFKALFRSKDRTLRDDEIEPRIASMKEKLVSALGVTFRE